MRFKKPAFAAFVTLGCALLLPSCEKRDTYDSPPPKRPGNFVFSGKPGAPITLLSTQLNPVEEAAKMRKSILKDFPGTVDFRPNDNSLIFTQIDAMVRAKPAESIAVGALHGDLIALYEKGALRPLDHILAKLEKRDFPPSLLALSRLDGKAPYYVPWMQASFVMAASKKALAYLPKDAKLDALTYDQLARWARAVSEKTGRKALGFPAGKNGLMHRFFQGYLYPSFTASALLKFRTADARAMWTYFKGLWDLVHPGSLVYSNMSEPLLTGEVWIAWDHTARLVKAFKEKPGEFVAFPAPAGPKGRGFMPVVSGLAIPMGVADAADPALRIDYLTRPEIQERMLNEVGFFPALPSVSGRVGPPHLGELASALDKQATSPDALPALPPMGLGERGGDYNSVFMLTFSGIVLEGKDPATVLGANAIELQRILDSGKVRCWLPDASEERPCKIE